MPGIIRAMKNLCTRLLVPSLVLALGSCSPQPDAIPAGTLCTTDSFSVSDNFEGARRGDCTVLSGNRVELDIVRESERVTNPSTWYSFRVEPTGAGPVVIELDYGTWPHRYVPKISMDGIRWTPLDEGNVHVSDDNSRAIIEVDAPHAPFWISAQELVLPSHYDEWMSAMGEGGVAQLSELGKSAQGRSISMLDSGGTSDDIVLLVGRQHPPEVSGAVAMRAFLEVVFSETELAARYRERFRIIAVPLLNPDGVITGNWRGNSAGADLNRDWGPFEQPETREVAELLDELDRGRKSVVVFVDFHSTKRNLFYTTDAADDAAVSRFIETWFERARARLGDYAFANEPRVASDTPSGRTYMFVRYGIPSLTYEVGDETDREDTIAAAQVFAEELMRLMLETTPPGDTR